EQMPAEALAPPELPPSPAPAPESPVPGESAPHVEGIPVGEAPAETGVSVEGPPQAAVEGSVPEGSAAEVQAAPIPTPVPVAPAEPLPEASAELAYVIVNEAGASVYSASPIGREEFPDFDANLRGTISIGRRLQDPLSELVKIDPQHVGVGLYQHDVNPKQLRESLDGVIESCVN